MNGAAFRVLLRPSVAVSLLALLAVVLRCRFIAEVFVRERVVPWGSDTLYHLWRIEAAVRDGVPPRFDPFVNAPDGARVIYPDGFDAALAWIVRLGAGAGADRFTTQVVAMVVMPLLGGAAVWAAYWVARRCIGVGGALLAALFIALLPGHAFLTVLGRVDHHIFEAAMPAMVLVGLAGVMAGEPRRRSWLAPLAAGLGLGSLAYLVPAAPLHLGALAVAVWATGVRAALARDGRAVSLLGAASVAAGVAALVALPDALTRQGWAPHAPSWLMFGLLVAAAVGCAALALAARRGPGALLAASAALALVAGGLSLGALGSGLGFVAREGTLAGVLESGPLWNQPLTALRENSWLLFAAPLLLLVMAREAPPARFALGLLGLVGCLLTVLQLRFVVVLLVPLAVAVGHCAARVRAALADRMAPAVAAGLVALLLASALGPALWSYAHTTLLYRQSLSLFEAADWLRENTPPAGQRTTGAKATYAVAASSTAGNLLAYEARRPVMASAMYHDDYESGLHAAIRVLYGDDPDTAAARRKVRYLVVEAADPAMASFHRRLVGLSPLPARPTLATRLLRDDGSMLVRTAAGAGPGKKQAEPGMARWRLVHDSPYALEEGGRMVPALKIFERVKGALIRGACEPGGPVMARAKPTSDRGRKFRFVNLAPCRGGAFSLRFPYAGEVELKGARAPRVTVPEAAVISGAAVPVAEGKL